MRAITTLAAFALALTGVACVGADDADEAEDGAPAVAAEGEVPTEVDASAMERWDVRLDDESAGGDFAMAEEGGGWHLTTGPAGITWRTADMVESGNFTARATFRENGARSGHREAYGLLVGGYHLDSPDQRYTYFLVRGTGEYLIKRREGDETTTVVDWKASDAVHAITEDGEEPTNTLAVRVEGETVRFLVNDQVVESVPTDEVRPHGLVGLRVNHQLDVTVTGFEVSGGGGGR